jgi:succinate dehydrogenase / fumarate reductase, cytochrome b subunit
VSKRPVFLNLFQIYFPVTAIASIAHRVSGFLLFLLIPFFLFGLSQSLQSAEHFDRLFSMAAHPACKLFLLLSFWAFIYHFCAGVRHVIMDFGYAETLKCARWTSWIVFILSFGLTFALGIYLS